MARASQRPRFAPTGRTQPGTFGTAVFVSDQLIIEACNTEGGTGGVARWATTVANRVKVEAVMISPRGNELNHFWLPPKERPPHRPYYTQFKVIKRGNGHVRRRIVMNTSDHAIFVETGRGPSFNREIFTTPGSVAAAQRIKSRSILVHRLFGTKGWDGWEVLSTAMATVFAHTGTANLKIFKRSAMTSFNEALRIMDQNAGND